MGFLLFRIIFFCRVLDIRVSEAVEILADEYGWSSSVPNLSDKLKRGSLRYGEAVELADVLGYDIVWQKRGK